MGIRQRRLVPGTEGYAEQAGTLIERWQGLSFSDKPKAILDLIPARPSWILDVGAGIGVDARALAEMGHRVVAVEPTDELREAGTTLHKSAGIEWVADGLPDLDLVVATERAFDLVAAWAVWMHLDEPQRRVAMARVASLIRPGGRLIMSLRHGPVPTGRRMFDVSAEETIGLAAQQHLWPILQFRTESTQEANRLAGVTWTHLAFSKS